MKEIVFEKLEFSHQKTVNVDYPLTLKKGEFCKRTFGHVPTWNEQPFP